MKKRKAAAPYISVPRTNHFRETANQDPVYRELLIRIRRIIAKFIAEKAESSHQSPDEASQTPLTITEQINLLDQLQRMGAGTGNCRYGSYPQEPVRCRPNVDHLISPAKKDLRDPGLPAPDKPSDQSDGQST